MQKIDARKVSTKELELLRRQAVRLHSKGKKYGEIAEALGVHRNRVSEWCRAYEEQGAAALKVSKSGRPKGFGRSLPPAQEAAIQKKICDHTPDQLKLAFAQVGACRDVYLIAADKAPFTINVHFVDATGSAAADQTDVRAEHAHPHCW